jgi:hypothetical protein
MPRHTLAEPWQHPTIAESGKAKQKALETFGSLFVIDLTPAPLQEVSKMAVQVPAWEQNLFKWNGIWLSNQSVDDSKE